MTQKENLLFKLMEIENQIAEVKGEEVKNIDTESWDFIRIAKENKVSELQFKIELAEKCLERAKKEAEVNAWLQTEEGKAFTNRLNAKMEEANKVYEENEAKAIKELDNLIKEQLGSQWGLCYFCTSQIRIGIVDETKKPKEDGTHNSLFGHDFTIYIEDDYYGEERFDINYGCMGSFSPMQDASRVDFLVGLAKVSSNKEMQYIIKNIHRGFRSEINRMKEEINAIKAQKMAA